MKKERLERREKERERCKVGEKKKRKRQRKWRMRARRRERREEILMKSFKNSTIPIARERRGRGRKERLGRDRTDVQISESGAWFGGDLEGDQLELPQHLIHPGVRVEDRIVDDADAEGQETLGVTLHLQKNVPITFRCVDGAALNVARVEEPHLERVFDFTEKQENSTK